MRRSALAAVALATKSGSVLLLGSRHRPRQRPTRDGGCQPLPDPADLYSRHSFHAPFDERDGATRPRALLSSRLRGRVLNALFREARLGGARQLFLDGGGFAGSSGGVPFALFHEAFSAAPCSFFSVALRRSPDREAASERKRWWICQRRRSQRPKSFSTCRPHQGCVLSTLKQRKARPKKPSQGRQTRCLQVGPIHVPSVSRLTPATRDRNDAPIP